MANLNEELLRSQNSNEHIHILIFISILFACNKYFATSVHIFRLVSNFANIIMTIGTYSVSFDRQ